MDPGISPGSLAQSMLASNQCVKRGSTRRLTNYLQVSTGVGKLQSSIGSVKEAIREPFQTVKEKTKELERLQAAGELIRE